MKYIFLLLLLAGFYQPVWADHITGGELYYTFTPAEGGNIKYNITVKVFMRCNSGRQFNNPAVISIFEKGSSTRVKDIEVALTRTQQLSLADPNRCITDPPTVCYEVGFYEFSTILPPAGGGYIVASQFVFRIAGIRNLVPFYSNVGTTYMGEIPGTAVASGPSNNSAHFTGSDLVVVCANNSFTYSFAAEDADGDELRYSFCDAYQGGSFRMGSGTPATAPPFQPVPYGTNFSGNAPLGTHVKINSKTGLITGIAPDEGIYVITVCVEEIRNGQVIATQRKDLQVFIASCTIAAASLLPTYDLCKESTLLNVRNGSASPLIQAFNWEVKDLSGNVLFNSAQPSMEYNFRDTGLYQLKLVVNRNGECADSTVSVVRVYPGFKPLFDFQGLCSGKPTRFKDATTSTYGRPVSWQWDFGNGPPSVASESQLIANPQYTYPDPGIRKVLLKVSNSNGCSDTVSRMIEMVDRPPLGIAFKDTTICINDQLQLKASGSGTIRWFSDAAISDPDVADPYVSPAVSTTFYTEIFSDGCINSDSVFVRVANSVELQPMSDTLICAGDTIRLRLRSNALNHNWTPVSGMLEPFAKEPLVQAGNNTIYDVTASIGGCTATARINVRTAPYPSSNAGRDTTICFGTAALLQGSITGSQFSWSAPQTLAAPQSLQTIARPLVTTRYILQTFDNRGCPKPGTDTVLVQVLAPVQAIATNDTVAVLGQPLQLQASGGTVYEWLPPTALSATNIPDPVARFSDGYGSIRYQVRVLTPEGCFDTTSVLVNVFATAPNVFVPTAFTPNGDGLNDLLRPIGAGILRIERFAVFNRWGQQLYAGTSGQGWDGRLSGQLQQSGAYVWIAQAIDYQGRKLVQKGTALLIR